jgi:hypothetical protein
MTSTKYIGMDVHKESISIAVRNAAGKIVMECVIETKASLILQFFNGLRGDLQVTFEEGTSAVWLYDLLKPHVRKLVVCDPRKNASMREGHQNDKIDACRLAELLRLNHLSPVYHGEHGLRSLNPRRSCARNKLRRIVQLMFIRRMIVLILAGVLFCATCSFGAFCELYCNTAPQSHSHSDMPGDHHDAHHNMSNCQDCTNHGARFSMNDSSCHHIEQAQLLDKSLSDLNLSHLKWQAVGSYAVSKSPSRGGRATPGFSNPFVSRQSSICAPLTLSLRI